MPLIHSANPTIQCKHQSLATHSLIEPLTAHLIHSSLAKDLLYLGWGYKSSGKWAQQQAVRSERASYLLLEDAFVRSIFPGYTGLPIYGIVADSSGIYYDYQGNSDLIHVLNGASAPAHWSDPVEEIERNETLTLFREIGASKYNCFSTQRSDLTKYKKGVLVVDQTKGDAALQYGGIKESDFDRMLNDAISENPDQPIYVRAHPDHLHRSKHSCFSESALEHPRVIILPSSITPLDCFHFCEKVYVGTSLLGMEALIQGKKVHTYGWPFYSGWGLTEDLSNFEKPFRKNLLSLEELFAAAYMRYSLYFHPETHQPCKLIDILLHLQIQKNSFSHLPSALTVFQFSPWKKQVIARYLKPKSITISHAKKNEPISAEETALVWGAKEIEFSGKIIRAEDGFIRSRGLGANFNFPLSWAFDDVGIYFDARSSSRLENYIENHQFSESELAQADALVTFLRENKLTKYNLGIKEVTLPPEAANKTTILIPGQVDSDASIKYGSPKIRNNRELLSEVRRQHPEAFICYKPHPDLLSGARKDAPLWQGIEQDVDHLVTEGDIISWIQAVDEVHTLTSTVGFEALMHQKPVHTYGLPFYAGWGLTTDWLQCDRRTTQRTLTELACAALILYPTYLNPKTGEYTSALNAAKLLSDPEFKYDSRSGFLKVLGKAKSWFNKLFRH